ncbi:MAG: HEAT repeat domain-containing protein [Deltaproteobacteria bacterium]|nr:HEAT repeat domain-containing protein [Deltaproteobacteria bacterium]
MEQTTASSPGLGQKNAVEIFINALEKSSRSAKLYNYASGQDVIQNIYENTIGALERALLEADQLEMTVKPFEIFFDRKVVYTNKEKKTSLSFALYQDGIRMLVFKKGFTKEELLEVIQILATDFTKAELMDQDLYCLFMEKRFDHFEVVGADILVELEREDPELKEEMKSFMAKIASAKAIPKTSAQRRLRPDDMKVLDEFRLNPVQFTRSNEEVSKVIETITTLKDSPVKERETVERLLVMGFHFLLNDRDPEQRQVGRDLVIKVALNILEDSYFDLGEALLVRLYQLQKEKIDQAGEYQKILDSIFSPDQLEVFAKLFTHSDHHKALLKILSQAPASSCRLSILLLGPHPWLQKNFAESVLKNLPGQMTWLNQEVQKNPANDCWEALINILASKPTQHFQKFLESLLQTATTNVRQKVLKQLAAIGTADSLKIFEKYFNSENPADRIQAYELISSSKNKNSLIMLKNHLESNKFKESAPDEREVGYISIIRIGGDVAFPWIEALWMQPGSGLFKKKGETERRMVLTKAMAKTMPEFITKLLEKTPLETLVPELKDMIQKISFVKKTTSEIPREIFKGNSGGDIS